MNKDGNVQLIMGDFKHTPPIKTKKIIRFFCLPVSEFSIPVQLLVLTALVFVFYLMYGYILELIFTLDGMKTHGWYLTLVQFAYYTLFALTQLILTGEGISRKIPLGEYAIIAFLTVGTMGFSNSSVGYLNYPTQVIFKSCKLIPVMIGSVVILGKTYTFSEVTACVCMCVGLVWFTLADSTTQPNFSLTGVVLVSSALLCDALIGNLQESAMRKYSEGATHVVLYSYSIGFLIILITLLMTDKLVPAASFGYQFPWEVYGRGLLLSATGFCGVQVVLTLVSIHGALIAVTITTCRKALTICLSFLLFAKPFTLQYVWGGLLVITGIYLNIYAKRNKGVSVLVDLQKLCVFLQRKLDSKRDVAKRDGMFNV